MRFSERYVTSAPLLWLFFRLSFGLSVRPSVTRINYEQTEEFLRNLLTPHASDLALLQKKNSENIRNCFRDFRPISRFISETIQYMHHSYNGRRITTRIRSAEWCHSQRPWWPLTQTTRPRHYLTWNISETARDRT